MTEKIASNIDLGITDPFQQVGEFTSADTAGPEAHLHMYWQAGRPSHLGHSPCRQSKGVQAQDSLQGLRGLRRTTMGSLWPYL